MKFHSQQTMIYLVMIDHLTGEQIGYEISRFYELGASNVQVIPSVTKKNRPACTILINCREKYAESVEKAIPLELGAGGWHVFKSEHHYIDNEILERNVTIRDTKDQSFSFIVKGKLFGTGNLRPEHDCVVELQNMIFEHFHCFVQYGELYHQIAIILLEQSKDEVIIDNERHKE